jgi:hypothetical protein
MYEEDHETPLYDWGCWDTYLTKAYGFYCLPADPEKREDVMDYLMEPMVVLKRSAGDLILTWDLVLGGVLMSIAVGMTYLICFRVPYIVS